MQQETVGFHESDAYRPMFFSSGLIAILFSSFIFITLYPLLSTTLWSKRLLLANRNILNGKMKSKLALDNWKVFVTFSVYRYFHQFICYYLFVSLTLHSFASKKQMLWTLSYLYLFRDRKLHHVKVANVETKGNIHQLDTNSQYNKNRMDRING